MAASAVSRVMSQAAEELKYIRNAYVDAINEEINIVELVDDYFMDVLHALMVQLAADPDIKEPSQVRDVTDHVFRAQLEFHKGIANRAKLKQQMMIKEVGKYVGYMDDAWQNWRERALVLPKMTDLQICLSFDMGTFGLDTPFGTAARSVATSDGPATPTAGSLYRWEDCKKLSDMMIAVRGEWGFYWLEEDIPLVDITEYEHLYQNKDKTPITESVLASLGVTLEEREVLYALHPVTDTRQVRIEEYPFWDVGFRSLSYRVDPISDINPPTTQEITRYCNCQRLFDKRNKIKVATILASGNDKSCVYENSIAPMGQHYYRRVTKEAGLALFSALNAPLPAFPPAPTISGKYEYHVTESGNFVGGDRHFINNGYYILVNTGVKYSTVTKADSPSNSMEVRFDDKCVEPSKLEAFMTVLNNVAKYERSLAEPYQKSLNASWDAAAIAGDEAFSAQGSAAGVRVEIQTISGYFGIEQWISHGVHAYWDTELSYSLGYGVSYSMGYKGNLNAVMTGLIETGVGLASGASSPWRNLFAWPGLRKPNPFGGADYAGSINRVFYISEWGPEPALVKSTSVGYIPTVSDNHPLYLTEELLQAFRDSFEALEKLSRGIWQRLVAYRNQLIARGTGFIRDVLAGDMETIVLGGLQTVFEFGVTEVVVKALYWVAGKQVPGLGWMLEATGDRWVKKTARYIAFSLIGEETSDWFISKGFSALDNFWNSAYVPPAWRLPQDAPLVVDMARNYVMHASKIYGTQNRITYWSDGTYTLFDYTDKTVTTGHQLDLETIIELQYGSRLGAEMMMSLTAAEREYLAAHRGYVAHAVSVKANGGAVPRLGQMLDNMLAYKDMPFATQDLNEPFVVGRINQDYAKSDFEKFTTDGVGRPIGWWDTAPYSPGGVPDYG